MRLQYCTSFNEHWFTVSGDDVIQRLAAIRSMFPPENRMMLSVDEFSKDEVRKLVEFVIQLPPEQLKALSL